MESNMSEFNTKEVTLEEKELFLLNVIMFTLVTSIKRNPLKPALKRVLKKLERTFKKNIKIYQNENYNSRMKDPLYDPIKAFNDELQLASKIMDGTREDLNGEDSLVNPGTIFYYLNFNYGSIVDQLNIDPKAITEINEIYKDTGNSFIAIRYVNSLIKNLK
jgi:hypothetical protein